MRTEFTKGNQNYGALDVCMGWDDRLASRKAPNTYPGHLRVHLLSDGALKKEMRGLSQEGGVNIPPLSAAGAIYSISDLN